MMYSLSLLNEETGKNDLGDIKKEGVAGLVFQGSSCKEDSGQGTSFGKDNPLKMSVPKN